MQQQAEQINTYFPDGTRLFIKNGYIYSNQFSQFLLKNKLLRIATHKQDFALYLYFNLLN